MQIVFKHFPLPFHQNAQLAAEATVAAHEQGKFWEYSDKLFENQRALDRASLEKYAAEVGLNVDKFKKALDSGDAKKTVAADVALGNQVSGGQMGTPTFYINGRQVAGALPFEQFKAIIDEELKKKGG